MVHETEWGTPGTSLATSLGEGSGRRAVPFVWYPLEESGIRELANSLTLG